MVMVQQNAAGSLRVSLSYPFSSLPPRMGDQGVEQGAGRSPAEGPGVSVGVERAGMVMVQQNAAGSLRVSLSYPFSSLPQEWGIKGVEQQL
jgi:hypothetical protein